MDGKGKKVYNALVKSAKADEPQMDVDDIAIAIKMIGNEDEVAKILEDLVKEGAVSTSTNDRGVTLYKAEDKPAPAPKEKPVKEKPIKIKAEKEDTLDDIDDVSDDDDDAGAPKFSGGGGGLIPLAVGALAIVLSIVAIIISATKLSTDATVVGEINLEDLRRDAGSNAAAIAELQRENTELKNRVDSLRTVVEGVHRIVHRQQQRQPAGGRRR